MSETNEEFPAATGAADAALRYEIRDRLGEGGIGEVFRAWDNQLGREVALKRLRDNSKEEETWREAKILAGLHHPNLVSVYDFGRDYTGSFVVMELVNGVTLENSVPRGGVSLEFFQEFADQLSRGLAAAHARKVVHRDLKPSNVMIQNHEDGTFTIKILDFGLAKSIEAPQPQTMDQNNSVMGSVFYMAPEQLTRQPVNAQTDIYSLGAIFYYVLTGRPPFEGELVAQIIQGHLNQTPQNLKELRDDLPDAVSDLVHKMLSKQPADRPASMDAVRTALRAAWGVPAASTTVSTTASPQSAVIGNTPNRPFVAPAPTFPAAPVKKKNAGTLVMAVVGVALLAGAGYFVLNKDKDETSKNKAAQSESQGGLNLRPRPQAENAAEQPAIPRPTQAPLVRGNRDEGTPRREQQAPITGGGGAPRAVNSLDPLDKAALLSAVGTMSDVEGTIVRLGQSREGNVKYLNFSNNFRDSLTLVFFMRGNENIFTEEALGRFVNQRVRVRGQISEHQGSPQIVISNLSQLEVLR